MRSQRHYAPYSPKESRNAMPADCRASFSSTRPRRLLQIRPSKPMVNLDICPCTHSSHDLQRILHPPSLQPPCRPCFLPRSTSSSLSSPLSESHTMQPRKCLPGRTPSSLELGGLDRVRSCSARLASCTPPSPKFINTALGAVQTHSLRSL